MNADFDITELGLMGRPFPAKFAGVCALSGERFGAGTSIRLTNRIGQVKALPVIETSAWTSPLRNPTPSSRCTWTAS